MNLSIVFIIVVIIGLISTILNRGRTILGYLMSIGLGFILGTANSIIPDYALYRDAYNSVVNLKFEYGYEFLADLSKQVGFDYAEFRLIIGIVGLVLMFHFINKLNINSIGILFIYIINSFFIDVSQIRNFMLTVFLVMAFVTLIENRKHSFFKSFVYILIGSSFQVLGYFFLLVYVVFIIYRIKKARSVLSLIFILSSLVFILPVIRDYAIMLSSKILSSSGVEAYLSEQTRLGFLLPWGVILISLIFSMYNLNILESLGISEAKLVTRIHTILLVTMLALPLLTFNIEFYRIYRDTFLLIPISSMFIFKNVVTRNIKFFVFFGLIFIMVIHFIITIIPVWNSNVVQLFF